MGIFRPGLSGIAQVWEPLSVKARAKYFLISRLLF